jgi:hypothetical protein
MRRALRDGRIEVYLGVTSIITCHATPRSAAHQRPIESRFDSSIRGSRCAGNSSLYHARSHHTIYLVEFNLDFYTEVQDLSYLSSALSSQSPRFASLNMAICDLVEDFGYVEFETLAVEDKISMVHLMRSVDRALGYAFLPPNKPDSQEGGGIARSEVPNAPALFSSALGSIPDAPKVQDVQERWVDHREGYDAWEKAQWRREGQIVQAAERKKKEEVKKSA